MGEGTLLRSTLPEIYEIHAKFGLRHFFSILFHVEIRCRSIGTLWILGFRCLGSRLEFYYISDRLPKSTFRVSLYKDKSGPLQKSILPEIDRNEVGFWTSGLLSYTLSSKNHVATKCNHFYFGMSAKVHLAGNQRKQYPICTSALLSYII